MNPFRADPAAIVFLTVVNSPAEVPQARFLIESLRSFGGEVRDCPVQVFLPGADALPGLSDLRKVTLLSLPLEAPFRDYMLADKVFACARAEELAGPEVRSLVWLNRDCLIANPPALFDLGGAFDVALRPVHIRNVGSLAAEPLDEYWQTVYHEVGAETVPYTVESFVDTQVLRPYYNTHCFAVDPARRLLQAWCSHFRRLVADQAFQAGPCLDHLHRIFLHQVVFSVVVMKALERGRIRLLPPEYSYPLHLQSQLSPDRRIPCLDRMVCAVYEETAHLEGIEIQGPLKEWLATRA